LIAGAAGGEDRQMRERLAAATRLADAAVRELGLAAAQARRLPPS
jgi:hypothetical protein